MPIKSMIRLNQLVTQQGDFDITAENSAKSALSSRSDADEALKNIVESLVQRHGIGSAAGGFLADDAQGVLAHFTSGVAAPLVIKHEGTDAAADIEIDSVRAISADALISSNFTVTGAAQSLTLEAAGGGLQKLLAQSAGTGADAVHLNASAGGFDVDSVKSSSMNLSAAGDASGAAVLTIGASHAGTDAGDTASIDMDAKTQVDIAAAGASADAIKISASTGGFDFDVANGYDLAVTAGGLAEVVTAGGASREVVAGDIEIKGSDTDAAQSLNLHLQSNADADALRFEMDSTYDGSLASEQNSVISLINAPGTGASAIKLHAEAGGLDFDAAGSIAMDAVVDVALASTEDTTVTASAKMVVDGQVDDTAISSDYSDPTAAVPALKLKSTSGGVMMDAALDIAFFAGLAGVGNSNVMDTSETTPDDAFTYSQNIADDMTTNNTAGLNHLILGDAFCSGQYDNGNVNGASAVWEGMGIPLSMASKEWYDFREAFGEVSLLNAITQASSGSTDSFYIEAEVDLAIASGNIFADIVNDLTVLDESGTAVNAAPSIDGTTSQAELESRIEVYVNGQRMALNGDCTPGISSGSLTLEFTFALEVDDIIIVKA